MLSLRFNWYSYPLNLYASLEEVVPQLRDSEVFLVTILHMNI